MRDRNRILVIGGTGQVGRELVRRLLAADAKVRVVTRDMERASKVFEDAGIPDDHLQDLEFSVGDLDEHGLLDLALEDADRMFLLSAPDPRQVELHANAIQAAKGAELKVLVRLSAVCASPESRVTLFRWHGQSDAALEAAHIPHAILRPHFFMQNLLGFAPSIAAHGAFHAPMGEGRIGCVDIRDIAECAAKLLLEAKAGGPYELTGPESLSFREMAAELSEALGSPVAYQAVDPEEAREVLRGSLPPWFADALVELYEAFHYGEGDFTTGAVEQLLGRKPRSFRAFAQEHAEAFASVGASN